MKNNLGISFANEYEKMIDFFIMSREEFLRFYGYLTEDDYTETVHDIINTIEYWHKDWYEDNYDMDGRNLKDIVYGMLVTDWINNRKETNNG